MAIEKGLYAAPEGLEEEQGEGLEIEIVDPEMVTLDDGSMEITIVPDANIGDMTDFDANLAEFLEDNALSLIADDVMGLVASGHGCTKRVGRHLRRGA